MRTTIGDKMIRRDVYAEFKQFYEELVTLTDFVQDTVLQGNYRSKSETEKAGKTHAVVGLKVGMFS